MSNDVEYTPGPWEIEDGHWDIEVTKGEYVIATAHAAVPKGALKENAHLIAAAPELLKAARHGLNVLTRIKATHDQLLSKRLLTELDNAIAKAEGRHE